MKVSMIKYLQVTLARIALPLILLTGVLWSLTTLFPAKSYADLLVYIPVAGSIYILAVWRFTLGADMRMYLRKRFKMSLASHETT
jgi:hypothetical protein